MSSEFRIGRWQVRPDLNSISCREVERRVPHQVMALLVFLAERPGEVVSKDELVREVWQARFVSDQTVSSAIYELRRALEDDAQSPRLIETIRKRGYRLMVAPMPAIDGPEPSALPVLRPRLAWAGSALLAGALLLASIVAFQGRPAGLSSTAAAAEPQPVATEVCDTFQQGRHFLARGTPGALEKAEAYLRRAIELDPTYAPAHIALAECYLAAGEVSMDLPAREAHLRARRAATRALEVSGGSFAAEGAAAAIAFRYERDWEDAEKRFRRLFDRATPGSCSDQPHRLYGELLAATGRSEEAIEMMHKAVDKRPLSTQARWSLAWSYFLARRFEEAEQALEETLALDPALVPAYELLGAVYLQLDLDEKAVATIERLELLRDGDLGRVSAIRRAFDESGVSGLTRWRLEDANRRLGRSHLEPVWVATQYALLADADHALEWLEQALREERAGLVWLEVHPAFDSLRAHPGYRDLAARLGIGPPPSS